MSFTLISCSSRFLEKDYDVNKTQEATVGSSIISWSIGTDDGGPKTGVKKELVYSGVSQNVLQFSYREYNIEPDGTFARPAFYQDLKYDVPSDNIINFKDLSLIVHSFSGQKIVYSIIKEPEEVKNFKPSSGLSVVGYSLITGAGSLIILILLWGSL